MISDKVYVGNSYEQGYVRAKLYKPDIIDDTPCAFACVIINEQWNEKSLLDLKDKTGSVSLIGILNDSGQGDTNNTYLGALNTVDGVVKCQPDEVQAFVELLESKPSNGLLVLDAFDIKLLFEKEGIFPLPVYSVESIIYSTECIEAMAEQQANALGGDKSELLTSAADKALDVFLSPETKENLASRLAERQLREKILFEIPTHKDLKERDNQVEIIFDNPYRTELNKISEFIENRNLTDIIKNYPIRESRIPSAIAKALEFRDKKQYESAVITAIGKKPALQDKIKQQLPELTSALNALANP